MKKKSKYSKIIVKKLSHVSKDSVKTTSDDGIYNAKTIMFISHSVMKIFTFEVRGGYWKSPCSGSQNVTENIYSVSTFLQ